MVGVLGAFMVNPEGDICFAQVGEHAQIAAIRIAPGSCAIAVFEDGSEDMFTTEIHADILSAMKIKKDILIAHVGDDGKAVTEYVVPLSVQL